MHPDVDESEFPEAAKSRDGSGRPRSAVADAAILDAATELFCDLGYEGLSFEGVAARAGVGKTTIYRRYPTKLDLVMAVNGCLSAGMLPEPNTGTLRGDLLVIARNFHTMLSQTDAGRAIPKVLAAKLANPELARAHEAFVAGRRDITVGVIRRGIERGDLPTETDPMLIADLITGALFLRVFVTGQPVTSGYLDALVDQILT
ncbi:MAG: TetR/AcrR family transcriptional regulator [Acidimicrobiia bacterium]